jgi:predicted AAA+ superfamily ATPase
VQICFAKPENSWLCFTPVDTLVGFFLPAYAGSERQKLRKAPKFYLFDNGVKRALDGSVDFDLQPGTFEYGSLFEQFVIAEIMRRLSYLELSVSSSFIATEGGGGSGFGS